MGIQTHRDHFVVHFDRKVLNRRIRTFLDPNLTDDFIRETFKLKDNRDWNLQEKRKLIFERVGKETRTLEQSSEQ